MQTDARLCSFFILIPPVFIIIAYTDQTPKEKRTLLGKRLFIDCFDTSQRETLPQTSHDDACLLRIPSRMIVSILLIDISAGTAVSAAAGTSVLRRLCQPVNDGQHSCQRRQYEQIAHNSTLPI